MRLALSSAARRGPAADEVVSVSADSAHPVHTRIAVALLVAMWLAFTFPAFTGKARFPVDFAGPATGKPARPVVNPELGDAFYAFYPWHTYLGDRLRAGDLPLWDPYRFAGTPFSANISTGTFYPPNWLYAGGHTLLAFTVIAVASILASLLMAYWFFRVVRLHPFAAALGAAVWTFSAFLMKWSTNEHVFGSAMWLPLALGGLEVARRGEARRGITLATAGLALTLLAGHAQIALIVWLATAIWALVGMVSSQAGTDPAVLGTPSRMIGRQAASTAAAFGLATGIAAIQLLPTAEFTGLILRQETTFELARQTGLPAEHAPTLLLPDYRGSPLDRNYAGPGVNYTETAMYAGILTIPLAVLGLLNRPGRLAAFFFVITAVGFLAVFATPLYRLILALPGFSRTLFVTRFIYLVDVGLAGLAAVGLHSLIVQPTRRSVGILLAALAVVVGVLLVLTVGHDASPLPASYVVPRGVRAVALALLGGVVVAWVALRPSRVGAVAVVVLAIVAADLWRFAFPFSPYQHPREVYVRSPAVESLASVPGTRPRYANVASYYVAPNGGLQYRLHGIEGYDPFVPRRIVELVALADNQLERARFNFFGPFDPAAFRAPVMDLLGVSTAVGPLDAPLSGMGRVAGDAALFVRPGAFPPAFLASCWERTPEAAVLTRLGSMSSSDLRTTAVVEDSSAARKQLPETRARSCRSGGDVTVEVYEPERVLVRASAEAPSVLVLTDAWFPGWRVRIDGDPAPLLRVDHALRGVALPAGSHRVEFEFHPPLLRAGAVTTLVTLLLLVAWYPISRRKRPHWAARERRP